MKIAIIGGGAAGIITAHMLNKNGHEIEIFEKQDILGGHIRTINKNLEVEGIASDLYLEGGVIEFSNQFHKFQALLDELHVPYEPVETGTGLFLKDGTHVLSPFMIKQNYKGLAKFQEYLRFWGLHLSSVSLAKNLKKLDQDDLRKLNLSEILKKDRLAEKWIKLLMMYCYSVSYDSIPKFSAEVAVFNLKNYMLADWFRIKGGVYSYIEKILDQFKGKVHLGTTIEGINRKDDRVSVVLENGESITFDKVVFATPPDKVLNLLSDPKETELKWFSPWKENIAVTTIHTDSSIYIPYNINRPSEFDFFEKEHDWGYNALLNQVCGISTETPYYLSFNLQDRIHSQKIVKEIEHFTPGYTANAVKYREEIILNNGANRTYFAGAWLGDGLHEGAVKSAIRVSELIGYS